MLTVPDEDCAVRALARFDLSSRPAVLVALSGGSDSLALLLATERLLARLPGKTRLIAATIDHGLRAGSALEAGSVGEFCARRGVEHRILTWDGEKPASGIAAAARRARYALLAQAAANAEADIVLTGHTLDDQAETVAMRAARGEGRGLAGMAGATLYRGQTWIVRPFLGVRRDALRRQLTGQGLGWIEDPTNRAETSERARVRSSSTESGILHWNSVALLRAKARMTESQGAAEAIRRLSSRVPDGEGVRIDVRLLDLPPAIACLTLRVLLAAVGRGAHLPDETRVATLLAAVRAGDVRATLGGVLTVRRRDTILLTREVRRGQVEARRLATSPIPPPWSDFLPGFDLAVASALCGLFGASPPPAPPCLRA